MAARKVLGRAVLELATDDKALEGGLAKADKSVDAFGNKVDAHALKIGKNMQRVGVGMSAAVTAPFLLFARGAVDAASDTEESLNKVRVVFGDASGAIEEFAAGSAKNLGLSRQAALDAAGTFGNLFSAIGLGRPEAAKMSKDVLTLAADLGSFNNVKPEEALEKLRAGLVGQSEPLRTMGINLTEAGVKTKAMAMGLGEAGRELTEGEKVQARYALIVEQSSLAQGDFANTSGSLANQQKIAAAENANLSAEMGTVLLPIMKQATDLIRQVAGAFMSLSPEIRTGVLVFVGLVAILGPLLGLFGTLIVLGPAIGAAFTIMLGPIGFVILALAAIALAVIRLKQAWDANLGDIQGKTQAVGTAINGVFLGVQLFVLETWRGIVLGITGAVNGVIGVINGFIDAYNGLAQKLGLPQIGRIEMITPNLAAVDQAIDAVASKRRVATIIAQMVGGAGGGGSGGVGGPMIGYASGGTVPGPIGAPQFAVVHGGETITPPGGTAGVPVVLMLDGEVLARAVGNRQQQRSFLAGGAVG